MVSWSLGWVIFLLSSRGKQKSCCYNRVFNTMFKSSKPVTESCSCFSGTHPFVPNSSCYTWLNFLKSLLDIFRSLLKYQRQCSGQIWSDMAKCLLRSPAESTPVFASRISDIGKKGLIGKAGAVTAAGNTFVLETGAAQMRGCLYLSKSVCVCVWMHVSICVYVLCVFVCTHMSVFCVFASLYLCDCVYPCAFVHGSLTY